MLKKLKNDKKGFTLVELIVVLVILAILAALLVPALTGYIDKAKQKSVIAETRSVVMAAQTLADEEYATSGKNPSWSEYDDVKKLAEVQGTINEITFDTDQTGKVATVIYTDTKGKTCKYTASNNTYDANATYTSATGGNSGSQGGE